MPSSNNAGRGGPVQGPFSHGNTGESMSAGNGAHSRIGPVGNVPGGVMSTTNYHLPTHPYSTIPSPITIVPGMGSGLIPKAQLLIAAEAIWLQVAGLAQLLGELERTQTILDSILCHNPSQGHAYLRLGHLFHNQQQYWQAAEAYQKAISLLEQSITATMNIPPSYHLEAGIPNSNLLVGIAYTALAHCWLMMDELPKAFSAYQRALEWGSGTAILQDSTFWFGVGLLYDRYGADELALEALDRALTLGKSSIISLPAVSNLMPSVSAPSVVPDAMTREIYYRMGLLLRNLGHKEGSKKCLEYIVQFPPPPLSRHDVKWQLAITLESIKGEWPQVCTLLQSIIDSVIGSSSNNGTGRGMASKRIVWRAKALLGWFMIKHQRESSSQDDSLEIGRGMALLKAACTEESNNQTLSTRIAENNPPTPSATNTSAATTTTSTTFTASTSSPPHHHHHHHHYHSSISDALPWYFYGRAQFHQSSYTGAYEAYQEVVHRDEQNVAYWNSIGILYMTIRQWRDAMDAFSKALQLNSNLMEIWWNLGCLYERVAQGNDNLDNSDNNDGEKVYNGKGEVCVKTRAKANVSVTGPGTITPTTTPATATKSETISSGVANKVNKTQWKDAKDAFQRAAELAPEDEFIKEQLRYLTKKLVQLETTPGNNNQGGKESSDDMQLALDCLMPRELDPFPFLTRSILLGTGIQSNGTGISMDAIDENNGIAGSSTQYSGHMTSASRGETVSHSSLPRTFVNWANSAPRKQVGGLATSSTSNQIPNTMASGVTRVNTNYRPSYQGPPYFLQHAPAGGGGQAIQYGVPNTRLLSQHASGPTPIMATHAAIVNGRMTSTIASNDATSTSSRTGRSLPSPPAAITANSLNSVTQ